MEEADRILLLLGYYADDKVKRLQVESWIAEADAFMQSAGVDKTKRISASASAIRSMWAEARDAGIEIDISGRHKIILSLIDQIRSTKT